MCSTREQVGGELGRDGPRMTNGASSKRLSLGEAGSGEKHVADLEQAMLLDESLSLLLILSSEIYYMHAFQVHMLTLFVCLCTWHLANYTFTALAEITPP